MKIGLVISTNEPELAWNAFRYGVKAIENKHSVKVFLLGKGVECEEINNDKFDVKHMMVEFADKGGTILTCGTCLKIRKKGGTELCPISTMQDMVDLTVDSDRVLTFG
jgi:sulfur relay (sulfurtransferase) complex TusBCD TusD component (DsrE family)